MTVITRERNWSTNNDSDEPEDFPLAMPETTFRTTIASYHSDPFPNISTTPSAFLHHGASWSLTLPIPVPTDILKPTLVSLRYMVKYGTRFDDGNSTIQSDVILSVKDVSSGVSKLGDRLDDESVNVYRPVGNSYAPRIVDDESGTTLVTVSAIKSNGGYELWSHFVDGQELRPNIRLVDPAARLYFIFNVVEYPTKQIERFLAVEITASWLEDKAARAEKEEADRLAAEAEARQARREAEMTAKGEAEREKRAQEELERKINAEVNKRVAEEVERLLRANLKLEGSSPPSSASEIRRTNAPAVADVDIQEKIKNATQRFPGRACTSGFAWSKVATGYQCSGGGHSLTWEELGL